MGRVFLAEHSRIRRRVAIKILEPHLAENPAIVRRFFAEARAVNEINHDHIVEITDLIEDEKEKYYVMELLDGRSLRETLEEYDLGVISSVAGTSQLVMVYKPRG